MIYHMFLLQNCIIYFSKYRELLYDNAADMSARYNDIEHLCKSV